jgi:hypothetical protein
MGKIVYHGTFSDEPPHVYGEPFHTGTMSAAYDRIDDEMDNNGAGGQYEPTYKIHKYEISDNAPTSRKTWDDPGDFFNHGPNPVPEFNQKRIYPYKNEYEDKASTSYVIPSKFVGNHVKHLGIQFQHFSQGGDYGHETAVNAISTMVGGKPPFKAK